MNETVRYVDHAALRPGVPAVIYFWSETCVPRHVNHGVARAEQLKQQIERLSAGAPHEAAYN